MTDTKTETRCPGSGGAAVGPFDMSGRAEMGHCEVCGEKQTVRRTDGNIKVHRLPYALTESEAWFDSPDETLEMWTEGFRPTLAHEVEVGDTVAFVDTFFDQPTSGVRHGRVYKVEQIVGRFTDPDYPDIEVAHVCEGRDNLTEADWDSQVWTKKEAS